MTGLSVSAAAFITARPVGTEPISAIMATPRWVVSAEPASRPPGTMLNTPGGSRPPISSASRSEESGACSGGFMITTLPVASGAPALPAQNIEGMIERNDAAYDAARLAHGEVHDTRTHRDRGALHFRHEAGVKLDLRGGD